MNISFLVHLVDSYGYLLVGGVIFLESMGLFLISPTAIDSGCFLPLAMCQDTCGTLINIVYSAGNGSPDSGGFMRRVRVSSFDGLSSPFTITTYPRPPDKPAIVCF